MKIKLQFWSIDFIFAIVIFGAMISILFYAWFNLNTEMSSSFNNNQVMQIQAEGMVSKLFSTGNPSNWYSYINTTNPATWQYSQIGLISNGSEISMQKVFTLMAMSNSNYTVSKQVLGISYNYYIQLYNNQFNLSFGVNPKTNSSVNIYTSERTVLVNGNPAVIKIYIFN